jgi:hypothetical protein
MDSRATGTLKTRPARGWSIPILALLGSLLLHVIVLWSFGNSWYLPSWLRGQQEKLVVRVMAPTAQTDLPTRVNPAQVDLAAPISPEKQPVSEKAVAPNQPADTAQSQDSDDGYLPPEFLSRTAKSTSNINLQDIEAPDIPGRLQLLLWINKEGEVTKIDIEIIDAPDWFTNRVMGRFKQARFEPGLRDGKPVASLMHIEVSF